MGFDPFDPSSTSEVGWREKFRNYRLDRRRWAWVPVSSLLSLCVPFLILLPLLTNSVRSLIGVALLGLLAWPVVMSVAIFAFVFYPPLFERWGRLAVIFILLHISTLCIAAISPILIGIYTV